EGRAGRRAGARALLRRPDAGAGAGRRGLPRRRRRDRVAARADDRSRARPAGPVVPVAFRHVHDASRRDPRRRVRRGAAGVRLGTQPRAPVPPRGHARDHARLGPRIPSRARRGGRRPGRAARRDRPQRRGEPAERAAAARALPRPGRAARFGRDPAMIRTDGSAVFPRSLDLAYPSIERGEGVWLTTADGRRILGACLGGAMVACLGHGVAEIAAAAAEQADKISYFYNHHFTSEPQERLADRLLGFMPGMARVRFVSGGSEANETALQLARLYHVERGDTDRWRAISPAQAYHGSSMGTLALTGRTAVQEPYTPYLAPHLHIPPSTWRTDPTGEAALAELDRLLERHGTEIAAFVCEPVSGAALPAYSPPERFWQGLVERRQAHGFLICFDEVVTGIGRVGSWLAAHQLPIEPDIVAVGKG